MKQEVLNNQDINSKKELNNSSIGIAAFVLSLFALLFFIILAMGGGAIAGIIFLFCAITSTVLAVVDLNKENRKKTLATWAIIFDWGGLILVLLGGIVFGGIYLFMKAK